VSVNSAQFIAVVLFTVTIACRTVGYGRFSRFYERRDV